MQLGTLVHKEGRMKYPIAYLIIVSILGGEMTVSVAQICSYRSVWLRNLEIVIPKDIYLPNVKG